MAMCSGGLAVRLAVRGIKGLLGSLDAEQRAAATLPDGPAQIIAPAGSGKTTTLIARLGVLLGRGVAADRIGVVTFNRDAAAELAARIADRLAPHVPGAKAIEVRTLHAMARQVLLDAGHPVRLLADRLPLLRAARRRALAERPIAADGAAPPPEPPDAAALDTIISAWKVEGRAPPPAATSAVAAFSALMEARGLIDFDDLVVGAVAALEADPTSWVASLASASWPRIAIAVRKVGSMRPASSASNASRSPERAPTTRSTSRALMRAAGSASSIVLSEESCTL